MINIPIAVALVFAVAGAFFIGIYILRRVRANESLKKI
jgi:hypothetical protein